LDQLTADLEQTTVQYEELTHEREALNTQINAGLYEKQRQAQAAGNTLIRFSSL
jgi:hypothetical protein